MERRIPEWHGWHAARRGLRTWCQARAQGLLEQIPGTEPVTAGGDKGYDTADFVAECRNSRVNAALLTVAL